jgi:hypothetical protein
MSRRPLEESSAKFGFQSFDLLGQGGLRDMQPERRMPKMQFLCEYHE